MSEDEPSKTRPVRRQRRPRTAEARERVMIGLAIDLAERQIRDGTASAQVITHYLKLGTSREKLEQEKLREESALRRARTREIETSRNIETLYENAIAAMRRYGGREEEERFDD